MVVKIMLVIERKKEMFCRIVCIVLIPFVLNASHSQEEVSYPSSERGAFVSSTDSSCTETTSEVVSAWHTTSSSQTTSFSPTNSSSPTNSFSPTNSSSSKRNLSNQSVLSFEFPDRLYLEKKQFTFQSLNSMIKLSVYNPLDSMHRAHFLHPDEQIAYLYESASLGLEALRSLKSSCKGYLFRNLVRRSPEEELSVYPFIILDEDNRKNDHYFWIIHIPYSPVIEKKASRKSLMGFERIPLGERDRINPREIFSLNEKVKIPVLYSSEDLSTIRQHGSVNSKTICSRRRNKSASSSPKDENGESQDLSASIPRKERAPSESPSAHSSSPNKLSPSLSRKTRHRSYSLVASDPIRSVNQETRSNHNNQENLENSESSTLSLSDGPLLLSRPSGVLPIVINLPATSALVSYQISIVPQVVSLASSTDSCKVLDDK